MIQDGDHEYSAVLVSVENSPVFRLVAPDNSTVTTYQSKPDTAKCKADLKSAGYDATGHVPHRDITLGGEVLPGNITEP